MEVVPAREKGDCGSEKMVQRHRSCGKKRQVKKNKKE
jgi:hypothetical protein